MKRYLSSLLLIFLAFVFVGCANITYDSNGGPVVDFTKSKVQNQVLKVWLDDTDGKFMDKIKPAFEKQNPGVVIKFQHMSTVDARQQLKIYGRPGLGADIFQFPHDHMSQAILDDLVLPLSSPTDTGLKDRLAARILPVAMDIAQVSYDAASNTFRPDVAKELFAVPISIESVTLYYNKKLVAEADIPTTFEDFITKGKAFDAAQASNEVKLKYFQTSSHWGDGYFVQFAFGAFGWTPFGKDLNNPEKVGFEDTKSKAAIKWMIEELKPLIDTGSTPGNGSSLFEEGKLAFILTGPWSVKTFKDKQIDFGTVTLPTIKVNGENKATTTFAGAQMVAVYKYTNVPTIAKKFVEFLQSDEAAKIQYDVYGKAPALKPEFHNTIPGVKDDPILKVMMKQLETSVPMPTLPEVTYYWGPIETMLKAIWDANKSIDDETKNAESSYIAAKKLAS